MKNIEKYRDKLLDRVNVCSWYDYFNSDDDCVQDCKACEERFVKWLFEDSEKPVLDETERKYLSEVIRPFRNKIATISKLHTYDNINYENNEYIYFGMKDRRGYSLPLFKQGTMYKGMQQGKHYTLQELGL